MAAGRPGYGFPMRDGPLRNPGIIVGPPYRRHQERFRAMSPTAFRALIVCSILLGLAGSLLDFLFPGLLSS
jgi:hypothetical protein